MSTNHAKEPTGVANEGGGTAKVESVLIIPDKNVAPTSHLIVNKTTADKTTADKTTADKTSDNEKNHLLASSSLRLPNEIVNQVLGYLPPMNRWCLATSLGSRISQINAVRDFLVPFVDRAVSRNDVAALEFLTNNDIQRVYQGRGFRDACRYGHLQVVQWWERNPGIVGELSNELKASGVSAASEAGHYHILDYLLGLPDFGSLTYNLDNVESADMMQWHKVNNPNWLDLFTERSIDNACRLNLRRVLGWWGQRRAEGVTLKYSVWAMDFATKGVHVRVLDWLVRNCQPVLYSERGLSTAWYDGRLDSFVWWKNSGIRPLRHDGVDLSNRLLSFGTETIAIQVFDFWKRAWEDGDIDEEDGPVTISASVVDDATLRSMPLLLRYLADNCEAFGYPRLPYTASELEANKKYGGPEVARFWEQYLYVPPLIACAM